VNANMPTTTPSDTKSPLKRVGIRGWRRDGSTLVREYSYITTYG
jgi:hypothetical protein